MYFVLLSANVSTGEEMQNKENNFEIKNDMSVPEGNVNGAYQVYVLDTDGSVLQSLHFAL